MNTPVPFSRLLIASLVVAIAASAHAQNYFGAESYPHYRGMSGLPGGGFGVRPDGSTGMDGAMSISTPIGFSLRDWHGVVGISSLSYDKSFQGVNILKRSNTFNSGGVGDLMTGYGGNWGAVTVTYELLSTVLDHSWNVQYQLPVGGKWYGLSVGVDDVSSHSGAEGEKLVFPGTNTKSRSVFVVGTALVMPGLYASLGKGDYRFRSGVFGNLSYSVTPRVKVVGEYDTWAWNYDVAYGLGKIPHLAPYGRPIEPVLSVGYIGNNRALAMLNLAF